MSFALRRGQQWITAPQGLGQPGQVVPPVLAADSDRAAAWVAPTIDEAIERHQLLRTAFGLTTEVRAIGTRLLNRQPWRFHAGSTVYVRGWPADCTALVVEQLRDGLAFPHYLVVDPDGQAWDIAQLRLSSRPIGDHG